MNFKYLFSCAVFIFIATPSIFSMTNQKTFISDFCEIFAPKCPTDRMHEINANIKRICGESVFKDIVSALNEYKAGRFKGSPSIIIKKMKAVIGAIAQEYHATILDTKSVESLVIASLSTLIKEFTEFANDQAFYGTSHQTT